MATPAGKRLGDCSMRPLQGPTFGA